METSRPGGARSRRRRALEVLAVLVMGVLAALMARPVSGQQHPGHGAEARPDPAPGILPPGDWTPEQVERATALVRRVEEVLPARFGDVDALPAMGFGDFGATAPGGYDHWGNPDWNDDDHVLDPEFPESLVFRRTDDGRKVLEAAMFMLAPDVTMETIPEELRWLPGWHIHDNEFCVDERGRFVTLVTNGGCERGMPNRSAPMMHVWIVDNPCGHRFGGVGILGLTCGEHTHGGQPGPGPTCPVTSFPPGTVASGAWPSGTVPTGTWPSGAPGTVPAIVDSAFSSCVYPGPGPYPPGTFPPGTWSPGPAPGPTPSPAPSPSGPGSPTHGGDTGASGTSSGAGSGSGMSSAGGRGSGRGTDLPPASPVRATPRYTG